MKKRIFYFNINYICNNNCVFCFSHNVGNDKKEITKVEFLRRLKEMKITSKDWIIINGGEPTIHKEFYEFISEVRSLGCTVKVYSNGIEIDSKRIENENVELIIPIHGSENVHNELTRNKTAYRKTIYSLQELQAQNIPYSIKFIISKEMLESHFDIVSFLAEEVLEPSTIYLSRMNTTVKSKVNKYGIPEEQQVKDYLRNQVLNLRAKYSIKFLDFPKCYIPVDLFKEKEGHIYEKEEFYFNDYKYDMCKKEYIKERLQKSKCKICSYSQECDFISRSYYIYSITDHEEIKLTLE